MAKYTRAPSVFDRQGYSPKQNKTESHAIMKTTLPLALTALMLSFPLNSFAQGRAQRGQKIPPKIQTQIDKQVVDNVIKYKPGKNIYNLPYDGVIRNFLIHVPASYDGTKEVPLVFMIHGTNQSGPYMYDNSGWPAKSETEGCIVVFPSALNFDLVDEKGNIIAKQVSKWNIVGLDKEVSHPEDIKDDVKFIRRILSGVTNTFKINENRIFATGFSNGGNFVACRLMVDMNGTFAAFAATCSGFILAEAAPKFPANYFLIWGGHDPKYITAPATFPSKPDAIVTDPILGPSLTAVTHYLKLGSTYHVTTTKNPPITTMVYSDSTIGAKNEFHFNLDASLGHKYPEYAPDVLWDFFQKHPRGAVVPDDKKPAQAPARRPRVRR